MALKEQSECDLSFGRPSSKWSKPVVNLVKPPPPPLFMANQRNPRSKPRRSAAADDDDLEVENWLLLSSSVGVCSSQGPLTLLVCTRPGTTLPKTWSRSRLLYGYKDVRKEHHQTFEQLLIESLEKFICREAQERSLESDDTSDTDEGTNFWQGFNYFSQEVFYL